MENPIKMDDLGVPLFSETSIFGVIIFGAKNDALSETNGTRRFFLEEFERGEKFILMFEAKPTKTCL